MDILFIQPPLSVDERYGRSVGKVGGHVPPLGLASLAAYLIKYKFKVDILDASVLNLTIKKVLDIISRKKPKSIGLTALTPTFHRAVILAENIKKHFPEILIIVGGHHASILPEKVMKENTCFDLLIFGEGEYTLLEIMQKFKKIKYNKNKFLRDLKTLKKIKGIAFKNKNKIVMNKQREPIKNLDELPFPARYLLPMENYVPLPNQYKRLPSIHMVAIRGCPFSCAFCSNNAVFGRKIRARSPKKVIEEIKHLMKGYGAREISFWDDSLTVDPKWINEFCDLIIKNKIDITWTCYSRVDRVNRKLLKKMKKSGCWNIFYGYESGSQKLLNNINKGITLEQIRNANKWTKEAGIEIRASFMLALPGENPILARKTINFAKELEPEYAQFCITTPYPGTKLYNDAKKYGKLNLNFSRYTVWEPVFVPFDYKDEQEIMNMEKKAVKSFYFRPKFFINKLRSIKSAQDLKRYLKGLRLILGFI